MHIEILVKEVREQKGLTISGLSRKSGVSVAHISDIEKAFKSPSLLQVRSYGYGVEEKLTAYQATFSATGSFTSFSTYTSIFLG